MMIELPDVQKTLDEREMYINNVGIKHLKLPLIIKDKLKGSQNIVGNFNFNIGLAKEIKGTHASRFSAILQKYTTNSIFSLHLLSSILKDACDILETNEAHLEISFPYFILKQAPISKQEAYLHYDCKFIGNIKDKKISLYMEVRIPAISCCPCSKEISKYNAHNQKEYTTILIKTDPEEFIWIEEIVEIAEKSASAPIYSLLKRPDEKFITELMYENPKFTEDIVRDCAIELEKRNIINYKVTVESFESIHNHSMVAVINKL